LLGTSVTCMQTLLQGSTSLHVLLLKLQR
jgi:hypothetical protein